MDEITDPRIYSLENSERWGIRDQSESGRLHTDRVSAVASTMASVSQLRRPPQLKVIEGGLRTEPQNRGRLPSRRSRLVVVK